MMTATQTRNPRSRPFLPPTSTAASSRDDGLPARLAGGPDQLRTGLMVGAAVLMAAAAFLPLWGMTLVSVQYPEGLRMVIYPTHIRGDISEINLLNHYIGMAEISNDYFQELKIIPALFGAIAFAALGGALVRRLWTALVPLALMMGAAVYGFWSMRTRLYQFGHDLDPTAPMDIEPFTPAMIGSHSIAQFASYAYFSWGTFLPMIACGLICVAVWLDLRRSRLPDVEGGICISNSARTTGS